MPEARPPATARRAAGEDPAAAGEPGAPAGVPPGVPIVALIRDRALVLRALTHASYAHEHPGEAHNETLAFLGDAVLGLVVAERLCRQAPAAGPGVLTARRAELVSARGLAAWAQALGLGPCLRLGRGEEQSGGRDKESILASAFEALLAALYLDGGLAAVEPVVGRLMGGEGGGAP